MTAKWSQHIKQYYVNRYAVNRYAVSRRGDCIVRISQEEKLLLYIYLFQPHLLGCKNVICTSTVHTGLCVGVVPSAWTWFQGAVSIMDSSYRRATSHQNVKTWVPDPFVSGNLKRKKACIEGLYTPENTQTRIASTLKDTNTNGSRKVTSHQGT